MNKKCFSIMPFDGQFNDIDGIIGSAAKECGLLYKRGDHEKTPGVVINQVIKDIHAADVIVADISTHNANVMYELGIAHQLLGQERVIILTQSIKPEKEFDIHQFRKLVYTHDEPGRAKLRHDLPEQIKEALQASSDWEHWKVIRGRLPRTQFVVRDLERIIEQAGAKGLEGLVIRCAAQLSSISISDHEACDPKLGGEYLNALLAERNAIRKALAHGARLKAVLNPPHRFTQAQLPDRLTARFSRLIGLLEGRSDIPGNPEAAVEDLKAIENCQFALSPIPMPNILILGNEVVYEGMKRGNAGGFDMTHCETEPAVVKHFIEDFDRFYEESHREMCRANPPDGCLLEQLKKSFRDAAPAKTAS
jgi:hypothetical protein